LSKQPALILGMQQVVIAANKFKKIEKLKFCQLNPLPDYFHYEEESPKIKKKQ
jgi:hypothetical protein